MLISTKKELGKLNLSWSCLDTIAFDSSGVVCTDVVFYFTPDRHPLCSEMLTLQSAFQTIRHCLMSVAARLWSYNRSILNPCPCLTIRPDSTSQTPDIRNLPIKTNLPLRLHGCRYCQTSVLLKSEEAAVCCFVIAKLQLCICHWVLRKGLTSCATKCGS